MPIETEEFESRINDFYKLVRQYRAASAALRDLGELWPEVQTRGLLVELALKTYLTECRVSTFYPKDEGHTHDLSALADLAAKHGLELEEDDLNSKIPGLNEQYFKHPVLDAKWMARYAMKNRPLLVSITPGADAVDAMIVRIVDQAKDLADVPRPSIDAASVKKAPSGSHSRCLRMLRAFFRSSE